MGFKTDVPPYYHCLCLRCGRQKVLTSVALRSLFLERHIAIQAWTCAWLGAQMRCGKCGTKGIVLASRR